MTHAYAQKFANTLSSLPNEIILTSHVNPDGDGLGSMYAMGEALETLGKKVYYILKEAVQPYYNFLEIHNRLQFNLSGLPKEYAIISFDCGSIDRLSLPKNIIENAKILMNLDHHLSNNDFGDINIVQVDEVSSTSVVYHCLKAIDIKITPDMASNLYLGLVFDTGRFSYSPLPQTFSFAAELLALGADHWTVYSALYRHNDFNHYKTVAEVTKSMTNMYDGQLVILDVDESLKDHLILEEVEGLINRMSNIKELEIVVAFIYESENATKLSFRSRGKFNVCDTASEFGGGGHKCASGATIHLPYVQARETVLKTLSKFFVS
ncbi:MAG: hypothetical protein COB02_07180 [Candidatus Cloacimonadota bacterium]|nr:MAG: hypothetical protein COB02_07180 [Candidatus Cloacimonadota bacterium]